jgi:hypothetical protein
MMHAMDTHKTRAKAARALLADLEGMRTPDGGRYNFTTILAAMEH